MTMMMMMMIYNHSQQPTTQKTSAFQIRYKCTLHINIGSHLITDVEFNL